MLREFQRFNSFQQCLPGLFFFFNPGLLLIFATNLENTLV
ncbi:unnamed protein product [Spirodela intermedia]|uniref:Uncharacterized protein n=1 Tax=Spirodela intermedia TaxID=51605 RepID=A0A7I8K8A3_SPIIN|nr:unnamed protein product [Spirodela intermedia]